MHNSPLERLWNWRAYILTCIQTNRNLCTVFILGLRFFSIYTFICALTPFSLSLFFSFALCFWACECYVLSSMCRGIVYIGERKTEWAPETQCKTKIEIPNKRQQHSHIKWMCWRDNDCRPRSQYVSHAILFSFSRSALSLHFICFSFMCKRCIRFGVFFCCWVKSTHRTLLLFRGVEKQKERKKKERMQRHKVRKECMGKAHGKTSKQLENGWCGKGSRFVSNKFLFFLLPLLSRSFLISYPNYSSSNFLLLVCATGGAAVADDDDDAAVGSVFF